MTIEIKWQHQKWCCHFYDYLAGWNFIDHLYTSDYNKIRERDKGENMQKEKIQQLFNSADVTVVGRFARKEVLAAVGSNGTTKGGNYDTTNVYQ